MEHVRPTDPEGMLQSLDQIQSRYGLIVLVLLFLLIFSCFMFWKLVWKVWSDAMKAKDEEISRISEERDKYQALVFERLESSDVSRVLNAGRGRRPVAVEHKDDGNI
jgi:hypothetical protein